MAKQTDNAYQKAHTASFEDNNEDRGEWVAPAEGVVIEGKLTRVFVIRDGDEYTANYAVTEGYGEKDAATWLIGEKAAFRAAIRARNIGDDIKVTYKTKVPVPDKKNQHMWLVDFEYRANGDKSEPVKKALKAQYEALKEDLPF